MNTYANLVLLTAEMEPRLFDLDFQLLHDAVLTLVAMFVLYFVLSYFLFNPVRSMLEKRKDKIAAELAEAAEAEASAKALRKEYEAKLANIEKEADEILSEARKRALISENQIIAEAKAEAQFGEKGKALSEDKEMWALTDGVHDYISYGDFSKNGYLQFVVNRNEDIVMKVEYSKY